MPARPRPWGAPALERDVDQHQGRRGKEHRPGRRRGGARLPVSRQRDQSGTQESRSGYPLPECLSSRFEIRSVAAPPGLPRPGSEGRAGSARGRRRRPGPCTGRAGSRGTARSAMARPARSRAPGPRAADRRCALRRMSWIGAGGRPGARPARPPAAPELRLGHGRHAARGDRLQAGGLVLGSVSSTRRPKPASRSRTAAPGSRPRPAPPARPTAPGGGLVIGHSGEVGGVATPGAVPRPGASTRSRTGFHAGAAARPEPRNAAISAPGSLVTGGCRP